MDGFHLLGRANDIMVSPMHKAIKQDGSGQRLGWLNAVFDPRWLSSASSLEPEVRSWLADITVIS